MPYTKNQGRIRRWLRRLFFGSLVILNIAALGLMWMTFQNNKHLFLPEENIGMHPVAAGEIIPCPAPDEPVCREIVLREAIDRLLHNASR